MKLAVASLLLILCVGAWAQSPRQKAQALVAQMTQTEKLALVHGYGGSYVGNVPANSRLKIPAINLEDGPQGVADGVNSVTCWPSSLAVAASWDGKLMNAWGTAMAVEQRGKGTNVMLGPDINLVRVPLGGRAFEMFGEDPTLAATLVAESVMGIQSQQVVGTAKHYIDNDQEYQRGSISVEVDERTQHELYYPQFQAAVTAGVGAIMCSYNRINGTYACENPRTLGDLKNGMGFEGWVMSDWGATHSTVGSANGGLDQEMPGADFFGTGLANAISSGQVSQARLDDMATRILTGLYLAGAMNNPSPTGNLNANVTSAQHDMLARVLAQNAITLLQNTGGILPLMASGKTFAVIGDAGSTNPTIAGGGSGHVNAPYVVTPLKGIQDRVGSAGKVSYAATNPITTAVEVAKAADYAIVFVGFSSSEGSDRSDLSLPSPQDSLISQVAAANPNTIVVLNGPGAVLMPWVSSVKAILFGFFPGQESGNAIASALFGDFNPSAKLPISFPVKENDWFSGNANQYPGVNGVVQYSEKLLVGYRWYDSQDITPLWPFGHGLSYTMFTYSNLQVSGSISSGLTVSLNVANSGKVNGSEVVQLYLSYPASAGEPPQVLRKFEKIWLAPMGSTAVSFSLGKSDISIYDISSSSFVPVSGTFGINVGSSSRDIRVKGSFTA
jgi:beta-glucosidase